MKALTGDLREFISHGGKILCIAGETGVGKTSYAISVAEEIGARGVLYVTSGVSYAEMLGQFPFLPEVVPEENFIDLMAMADEEMDRAAARGGFLTFPPYLSHVLERFAAMPEPRVLIMDDWSVIFNTLEMRDSIGYERMDIRSLQRHFLRTVKRMAHTAIIVDDTSASLTPSEVLFLMADGLLHLDMDVDEDGFPFRMVTVKKLRGTRITQVKYPFTIIGGRVLTILPAPLTSYRGTLLFNGAGMLKEPMRCEDAVLTVIENVNTPKEVKRQVLTFVASCVPGGKVLTFLPPGVELGFDGASVDMTTLKDAIQRHGSPAGALREMTWDIAIVDIVSLLPFMEHPIAELLEALEFAREEGRRLIIVGGSYGKVEQEILFKLSDVYIRTVSKYGVHFVKPCKPRGGYLALMPGADRVELVPMT